MLSETDFSYSVFGLSVRSNLPIPGLSPADADPEGPQVGVRLRVPPVDGDASASEATPFYVSSHLAPTGEPALRIWQLRDGAVLHLRYFDGMQFWVDREGRNIWANWPDGLSIHDAATYLLGPVLGLLLRLRGATCLHASAVVIDGKAIAFVGAAGAGKSTTAAALARHGCPVLSDDIVALSERGGEFEVLPSYPYLCLWPEPVSSLYGSADAAPRLLPTWEKRQLSHGCNGVRFEGRSLPLAGVYILAPQSSDILAPHRSARAAEIAPISREHAFLSLIANTYATNVLSAEMRAREFEVLGRLMARVPVRRVSRSKDLQLLDELCHLICADASSLLVQQAAKSNN
jgi:hypothetical protein